MAKVHLQPLVPETKDFVILMLIIDDEVEDMHLMVDGQFMGHISKKMWTIIQEERLQSLSQMLAVAEYCEECDEEE